MGRAYFDITSEALIEVLHLPPGTRIVDARSMLFSRQASEQGPQLQIIVEHNDLPIVAEGECIPMVCPMYKSEWTDSQKVSFVGWQ